MKSAALADRPATRWDYGLPVRLEVAEGTRGSIAGAALRCVARYGLAKTTLDDVAREAGCSRATIYRAFPGGKDELTGTLVLSEVAGLFAAIDCRVAGAEDLEEVLVGAMDVAVREISGHEALGFVLMHEPEVVLPRVAFSAFDTVLAVASAFLSPYLARWLEPEDARRVGEWVTRIVISYLLCPPAIAGSRDGSHRPDEDYLRHLVTSFVLPGIRVLQETTSN